MQGAKVSVVIPIYNVEDYLQECLDSVTRQTLSELEIICVNDGSTDDSLAILKTYAERDNRIVILDGPNGGYGKAMNRGIEVASGDYIGIVEPDDYIALTMFEDLYEIAFSNQLDFVKADFYRFKRSTNGDMRLFYNHIDKTDSYYGKIFNPSEDPEALRFIMNTWSGIYRRSFLEQNDIRHNETPGASFQDNGFWFQTFVYAKRATIIAKPYYRNRRDNPNSSVKDSSKVYSMNVEYDFIESLLRPQSALWDRFKSMFWLKRYHNYMFTLGRIDVSCAEEYCERFSRDFLKARELNELDESVYLADEWESVNKVIDNPKAFYRNLAKMDSRKKRRKAMRGKLSKGKAIARKIMRA